MLILVFSMFDRRRLLYMTAGLYLVVLLYHGLVLGTITWDMGAQELVRLGFGATVVTGTMMIARYRINRRRETGNGMTGPWWSWKRPDGRMQNFCPMCPMS